MYLCILNIFGLHASRGDLASRTGTVLQPIIYIPEGSQQVQVHNDLSVVRRADPRQAPRPRTHDVPRQAPRSWQALKSGKREALHPPLVGMNYYFASPWGELPWGEHSAGGAGHAPTFLLLSGSVGGCECGQTPLSDTTYHSLEGREINGVINGEKFELFFR